MGPGERSGGQRRGPSSGRLAAGLRLRLGLGLELSRRADRQIESDARSAGGGWLGPGCGGELAGPLAHLLKLSRGLLEHALLALEPGVDRDGGGGERAGLHPPSGDGIAGGGFMGPFKPIAGVLVIVLPGPGGCRWLACAGLGGLALPVAGAALRPGARTAGSEGLGRRERAEAAEHLPAAGFISPDVVAAGAEHQQGDGHAFSPWLLI